MSSNSGPRAEDGPAQDPAAIATGDINSNGGAVAVGGNVLDQRQTIFNINAPTRIDFGRQVAAPGLVEGEYVVNTCRYAVPRFSTAVTPSADDMDYLARVLQRYHAWEEAPSSRFVDTQFLPLAYMEPEIVHRRVTGPGASTVQLWSACDMARQLMSAYRVLVLGRPGIGKTSLLQFLAQRYAGLDTAQVLPVVVSLRAWSDPPDRPRTLLQYILDFLVAPVDKHAFPQGQELAGHLQDYLADANQQRRLLFFLDDYNRMPRADGGESQRRIDAIREFADTYFRAIIVVVSRSLEYDGRLDGCDPAFEVVEMNPWSPEQIAAYLRQHAPSLLPYARDARLLNLADIPFQLVQLIEVVREQGNVPLDTLFSSVQGLLKAFVERLFLFSERAGEGQPGLRAQVSATLAALAAGLARHQKRGSYVSYSEALSYLPPAAADPNRREVLKMAADATILDVVPDWQQLGFERQQLEDYFAGLLPHDPPPADAAASAPATLDDLERALEARADPLATARGLDTAGMFLSNGQ